MERLYQGVLKAKDLVVPKGLIGLGFSPWLLLAAFEIYSGRAAVKKILYMLLLFLFAAGTFFAGSRYNQHKTSSSARKPLYYVDPMHPAYKSDKPGIAPDCGMQLKPVYAADLSIADDGNRQSSLSPGAVRIDPAKQQLFGVRMSSVEESSGAWKLRLFGRVTPDEASIYRLNAGIEGYIREVSAVTTGSLVRKGQELATFSAPMAAMTIQTYLLNMGAEDRFKKSAAEGSVEGQSLASANANIQQRTQQLQNLGMSVLQMEEIRRTRQFPDSIKIVAPADGFVLTRNVSPGLKFDRGAEWYRIADLNKVWIMATVSSREATMVRPGMTAQVSLPDRSRTLQARVSDVLPQFDITTGAFKVRLEADNPGYVLRPDMFVNVELSVRFSAVTTVPADAVLDSGLQKTVFVERGEGFFEPRRVETGWRFDDRVQIISGLATGERIVASGNFLIGSESRLKAAAAGMSAPLKDPACGTEVDGSTAKSAGLSSDYDGEIFYFSSEFCKRKFELNPGQYLAPASNTQLPARQAAPHSHVHGGHHG